MAHKSEPNPFEFAGRSPTLLILLRFFARNPWCMDNCSSLARRLGLREPVIREKLEQLVEMNLLEKSHELYRMAPDAEKQKEIQNFLE